jgi:hypothetical protein
LSGGEKPGLEFTLGKHHRDREIWSGGCGAFQEVGRFGSGTAVLTIEKDEDGTLAAILAGCELDGTLNFTLFDQA